MRSLIKVIFALFLSWSAAVCAVTAIYEASFLPRNNMLAAMLGSFALGILIFLKWHLAPMYIFGHEMTHFLTAKLFLKRTGRISLHMDKGFVEVEDSNVFITLAPYFIPFYSLLFVMLYAVTQLFFKNPWLDLSFACLVALGYAYHCLMTCHVLGIAQTDLQLVGHFLSVSIILAGNMFLLLLAILIFTKEFTEAFYFMRDITLVQGDILKQLPYTSIFR